MLDVRAKQAQVAKLPGGQIHSTYEHLQAFLVDEIQRMFPERVHFHPHHTLQVWPHNDLPVF
jgi:hypothetical protein